MDSKEDNIKMILTSVANELGIEKWRYQLNIKNYGLPNYLGNITPVSLEDESSEEVFHLVIKCAPREPAMSAELREFISCAYEKEVYVYTTLIPMYKSLGTGINYEKLFPNCYFANLSQENRYLVLNDMRSLGFVNHVGKYLDIDHINVSLKAIAQFHAQSIILDENKIYLPNNHVLRPMLSNDYKFCYLVLKNCMQKYYIALFENTVHSIFFVKLKDNCANYMDDSALKAKRLVYGHGDFWKGNILFEYLDQKPVRACLVDYQISRLLNPAQDVLFLLMTGTESSTRRSNFKKYLSTYYNELFKTLSNNGLDPSAVYPEEDFHHDLQLVFPFCFILVVMSFVLWLGIEDLHSLTSITEKDISDGHKKNVDKQFIIIIEDLITDFKALGYIED